jgi:hypothetical protein
MIAISFSKSILNELRQELQIAYKLNKLIKKSQKLNKVYKLFCVFCVYYFLSCMSFYYIIFFHI